MRNRSTRKPAGAMHRRDALKLISAAGVAGAAGSFGLAAPAIGQSSRTLKFGHMVPTKTVYHQAIQMFGDELSKLSDGKLKLQIFPSSQLGPISEMLQSVQAGALEFSMAVPAWYSNFMKPMDVFTLPYIVSSPERLKAALEGDIGAHIEEMGTEVGFQIIGYWLLGQRSIVNRLRPVETPADCKDLKLRVINSEVYMATFRALGANPIAMDPSELYLALQQGIVDGFEYPLPDILDQKLYEVAEYISLDEHTTDFFLNTTSPKTWAGFSSEEQQMVSQAMKTAMDWQWDAQPKDIARARGELEKLVNVNPITPDNKKLFLEATQPVYKQFEDSIGKEWLEQCVKALGPGQA
ncbi:TRAP transporter substrate-binding protein [Microbaculum marinum]|uniref:TRAP transporter substrate-binding protein n=1 Tax=Microbaculum marinum TaxID=1764581 RepID=A0AAW9RMK3_9HYPH